MFRSLQEQRSFYIFEISGLIALLTNLKDYFKRFAFFNYKHKTKRILNIFSPNNNTMFGSISDPLDFTNTSDKNPHDN